ncbi:hypothetical protein M9H77_20519 [Catharanthus roseus]|uniref:Uncharacterized protein n=1 Tax=Catharanthus roseus TaxID=4058 RepID=A0ACC0AKE7_CATRO|nr:hypothetical protein M9H77_20519 [Catharanthus roseus]
MRTNKGTKKQNKYLRGITAPIRALNRIFMNTMFSCAASFDQAASNVVNCGIGAPHQVCAELPRSFSVNSSVSATARESIDREEKELRELIRVVSKKLNEPNYKLVEIQKMKLRTAAEMRSYSVGVGKMGRIDEDWPCEFKELGDDNGGLGVYPRSRSCAVTRKTVVP